VNLNETGETELAQPIQRMNNSSTTSLTKAKPVDPGALNNLKYSGEREDYSKLFP
jgi:hypothetical protein